jgi:hypothetical protein
LGYLKKSANITPIKCNLFYRSNIMLKELSSLASRLDRKGFTKEADILDGIIQKLAQVATVGAPGLTYSGGRGYDLGGSQSEKFYKAKPKTMSEFNHFLGSLISEFAKNPYQKVFSKSVIDNPPSMSDSTWNDKTAKAFLQYCVAAGFPAAGLSSNLFSWKNFAVKNGYEPTLNGIYAFWEDTIDKVESYRGYEHERHSREYAENMRSRMESEDTAGAAGRQEDRTGRGISADVRRPTYDPMDPLAGLDLGDMDKETERLSGRADRGMRRDLSPLKRRIHSRVGAGTHLQLGAEGERFLSTLAGQVSRRLDAAVSKSDVAAEWFTQSPEEVLPESALRSKDVSSVYNGSDPEIKAVYAMIQQALNKHR